MDIYFMPTEKLKIICVGGGIAGCTAAVALRAQGHEVYVLERETELRSRGAGLTLPVELVEKLLQENIVPELKSLTVTHRKFLILESNQKENGKVLWEQPLMGKTLHWTELYQQLRTQIPNNFYYKNCNIVDLYSDDNKANVILSDGRQFTADLIICADGSSSICRSKIYPNLQKKYAGYIAWRGIALNSYDLSEVSKNNPECLYYYGTTDGHLIAYNIIDKGKKKLNWVLYQRWNEKELPKILIDKRGIIHKSSLLPGTLSSESQNILHQHAIRNLPSRIAKMVCETQQAFLQVIYSLKMPKNSFKRFCFLGDASDIYFPHIGSASAKAIEDAILLATSLSSNKPLDSCLSEWNDKQSLKSENLHKLSQAMGLNLVIQPPLWQEMDNAKMSEWWSSIITGKTWYFTETIKNNRFFSNSDSLDQAALENDAKPQKGQLRAKL
jgi:2-polyprenyl-6-methoxyphenol hydroxylase-like FAD-dependent oxidoreductase